MTLMLTSVVVGVSIIIAAVAAFAPGCGKGWE